MPGRPLLLVSSLLLSILLHGGAESSEPLQRGGTPAATAPDVARLGPQVGEKVPDFTLPDKDGRQRSLSSLMGENGLVLVFNRSVVW